MELYIANLTRQEQDFHYRLPEKPNTFRQHIPIGGQIKIPHDLDTGGIEAIVKHHAAFGLIDAADIDRTKPFAGLCYCVGKRVPIAKIVNGVQHNDGVLFDRGVEQRKEAAVALNDTLGNQLKEAGGNLKGLEVTIEEQKSNHKDPEIGETVRVSEDMPERREPSRKSRGRR